MKENTDCNLTKSFNNAALSNKGQQRSGKTWWHRPTSPSFAPRIYVPSRRKVKRHEGGGEQNVGHIGSDVLRNHADDVNPCMSVVHEENADSQLLMKKHQQHQDDYDMHRHVESSTTGLRPKAMLSEVCWSPTQTQSGANKTGTDRQLCRPDSMSLRYETLNTHRAMNSLQSTCRSTENEFEDNAGVVSRHQFQSLILRSNIASLGQQQQQPSIVSTPFAVRPSSGTFVSPSAVRTNLSNAAGGDYSPINSSSHQRALHIPKESNANSSRLEVAAISSEQAARRLQTSQHNGDSFHGFVSVNKGSLVSRPSSSRSFSQQNLQTVNSSTTAPMATARSSHPISTFSAAMKSAASSLQLLLPPEDVLEGVPESLRPLFLEMQQYAQVTSAGNFLHGPADDKSSIHSGSNKVQYRYMTRPSKSLESLPNVMCKTVTGDLIQVPLPGRRGVQGWRVNKQGNVVPTKKLTSYLGMSPNANAVRIMQHELEAGADAVVEGAPTLSLHHQEPNLSKAAAGRSVRHQPSILSPSSQTATTATAFFPHAADNYNAMSALPAIGVTSRPAAPVIGGAASKERMKQQGISSQWLTMKHHRLLESVEGMDSAHAMEVLYPTHNRYTRQQLPEKGGLRLAAGENWRRFSQMPAAAAAADQEHSDAFRISDGFLAEAINEILLEEHNEDSDAATGAVQDEFNWKQPHNIRQNSSLLLTERQSSWNVLGPSALSTTAGFPLFEASDEEVDFEFIMDPEVLARSKESRGESGTKAGDSVFSTTADGADNDDVLQNPRTSESGGAAFLNHEKHRNNIRPDPRSNPHSSALGHINGTGGNEMATDDLSDILEEEVSSGGGNSGNNNTLHQASAQSAAAGRMQRNKKASQQHEDESSSRSVLPVTRERESTLSPAGGGAASTSALLGPAGAKTVALALSALRKSPHQHNHSLALGDDIRTVELATKLIAEGSDSGHTSQLSMYMASEAEAVNEDELEEAFAGMEAALEASRKARLKGLGVVSGNLGQFHSMKDVAATVLMMEKVVEQLSMAKNQEAKIEARLERLLGKYLEGWGQGLQQGEMEVLSLQRLKEVLLPKAMKPPPPELAPFLPDEGGPAKVTDAQVKRRINQCFANRNKILDLAIIPRFTKADFGIVFEAIRNTPGAIESIKGIRAQGNLLNKGGVNGLMALLRAMPGMTELDVSNCQMFGPEAAQQLGQLLQPRLKLSLSRLVLARCPIKDSGFHSLSQPLQFNRHVQHLDLTSTGITDVGLRDLDQLFKENSFISTVKLGGNRFSTTGIASLSQNLQGNQSLTELDLTDCGLCDDSAVHLSAILANNPSLHKLLLSSNGIGWKGGRELAKGLVAADVAKSQLEFLQLDNNQLGHAAAIELLKAVQMSSRSCKVSLTGCLLLPIKGHPTYYDPLYPNGYYILDLSVGEQYDVATKLVNEVWKQSKGASWMTAQLDGRKLTLKEDMKWPENMPHIGVLKVHVISALSVDFSQLQQQGTAVHVISPRLMACATSQLEQPECSDVWRSEYVQLLTNIAHVTSAQAAALLRPFDYRKEKLEAARMLVSVTVDLHLLSSILCSPPPAGCLDADDLLELLNLMGVASLVPQKSPLEPGWQTACSGWYSLDLGLQGHRWFAMQFVELGQRQSKAVDPLSEFQRTQGGGSGPPIFASPKGPAALRRSKESIRRTVAANAVDAMVRLGDCRSRFHEFSYNGQQLDAQVIYLSSSLLPTSGTLTFHFMNVPMDRWRLRCMPMNALALVSPLLYAPCKEHEDIYMHLESSSNAWEELFLDMLRHMRLMGSDPSLAMWQRAHLTWKADACKKIFAEVKSAAESRHVAYNTAKAEAEEAALMAANAIHQETEGKKKKGKSKQGSPGGGKSKAALKAAKEAQARLQEAAEAAAKRLEVAAAMGQAFLHHIYKHAITFSMNCVQMLCLIRTLPDMMSRLALLELLYPTLWDRSCLVDVIMDMDYPVLLPLSGEELNAKQEEERLAGKTFVRDSMHRQMMRGSMLRSQGREGAMAASAEAAAESSSPALEHPSKQGTLPLGFAPSEDTSSDLLAMAAGRMGWCNLNLPWARPGALTNVIIHLNLGLVDNLQCLYRLCHFSDCCMFSSPAGSQPSPILVDLLGDGGPFEITPAGGPALDQILEYCSAAFPEAGLTGLLEFRIDMDEYRQRQAAAVMIQAAWRGQHCRKTIVGTIKARFGKNRWRAAWACYVWYRRLAFLRNLACDLAVQRIEQQLWANSQ